jgi:Spy/CpxP family protein refolding chaperone
MSLRNFIYVFLSVCLILPVSSVAAQMPDHHFGMGAMMRGMATDQQIDRAVESLQRGLNLSATQADSVRQLVRSRRDAFQSIREQARPKYEQLMSLLKQPNPDPATVGRATIELKAIHDRAMAKQADVEKQFMSLLTPAQQQTVNNLRDQARTSMALRRLGLLETPERGMLTSSLWDER